MFLHWIAAAVATLVLIVGIFFSLTLPPLPLILGVLIALVWIWPACLLLYRRWGRVMPLVTAHALIDTVAFVGYALLAGRVDWLPTG